MVSIQGGTFIYNIYFDPLPIAKLSTQDAFGVLNVCMLNFALISSSDAFYMESPDGIDISSLFDVVIKAFGIIIAKLKPIQLGFLVVVQSKFVFNFS